jgi:spore germination cell wall hydrolase CwlJ-like protein
MIPALTLQPLRPWRTHPRETTAVAVLGGALLALAGVSGATPTLPSFGADSAVEPAAALPKPLPTDVRDLPPETALSVNSRIPVASGPNPAASPFALANASGDARARALECLTSAIYYEAGQESSEGQRAVAQVVLNRVRHPAFPNSVCGVVYEGSTRTTGCQFTFTCDGSMARAPVPALWNRARLVAGQMLAGAVYAPAGHATHYHANYVVPYWASSLVKTTIEGAHIFYRWPGGWGQPKAFSDRWSGHEGNPAALRLAALSAPHFVSPLNRANDTVQRLEAAGAKVSTQPGGRVRVLFSPQAREAVEKVKVVPYVERASASDNLRFALNGSATESDQPAFGPTAKETAAEITAQ